MALRDVIFDLSKAVISSSERKEINKLLFSLNFDKDKEEKFNRSSLGYVANKQHLQLLGYILTNEHKLDLPMHVPELLRDELELLFIWHNEVERLISSILIKVPKYFTSFKQVIDPFFNIAFTTIPVKMGEIPLKKLYEKISDEFSKLTAFVNFKDIHQNLTPDQVIQLQRDVEKFQNVLISSGVHNVPEILIRIQTFRNVKDTTQRTTNLLSSLTILKTIIQIIDQIFFQALLFEKLQFINKNNLISIKKDSTNSVGHGLTLITTIDKSSWVITPNDIVLIDGSILGKSKNFLGWVQGMKISLSDEIGNIQEINLWVLDDNLNPFMNLLK